MTHPNEIMRVNSDMEGYFSAPITRRKNNIDCGWSALPCLAERLNLQKLATAGTFLVFFTILGMLQGAMLSYFRGTSHIWMEHYQYSDVIVDWLLYANELFVGIFALVISYWGQRIHRISWLGGLAIFQAFGAIILVIPEVHDPHVESYLNRSVSDFLCTGLSANLQVLGEFNYVAIAILFLFQLIYAFANISFYTLGISYLDDNIEKDNAPIYFAIPLAAKIFGKQLGLYLSWIPALTNNLTIFTTPMWLVLAILIFIFGSIITLFPESLPAIILKKAVASLLSLAEGENDEDTEEVEKKHDGFFVVLWRLIKHPVLMLNIAACTVMMVAFVNLELYQNKFFQSSFFVHVGSDLSGYQDNIISKITNVIKYPFIATSLIASGFIIAKTKPKAKYLALFNVIIYTITALSFISFPFLSCDIKLESEIQHRLTTPFCSSHCGCPRSTPFMPVCTVEGQNTYFSPCHAGCRSVEFSNMKIYSNCTCGENIFTTTNTAATEGSCDQSACLLRFGIAQAGIVMATSCAISTVITNLLINMRVVLPGDKAMALALESTFLGIIPYVPGKLAYAAIADSLCRYYGNDRCLLNSKSFGLFFSITTIVLLGTAALISVGVVLLIGEVHMWSKDDNPSIAGEEYHEEDDDAIENDRRNNRNVQITDLDDDLDFRLRTIDDTTGDQNNQQNQNSHNNLNQRRRDMLESAF